MQISKTETTLRAAGIRSSREYQAVMIAKADWILPHSWEEPETEEDGPLLVYRAEGFSLREWTKAEPTEAQAGRMVQALSDLWEKLERYLLDERKLYWDPDWIRIGQEDGKLRIVYLPFEDVPDPEEGFLKQTARFLWETSAEAMWQSEGVILQLHRLTRAAFAKERGDQKWQLLLGDGSAEEAAAIVRQYEACRKQMEETVPGPTQEERQAALAVIAEPFREETFWEKWLRLLQFLREKSPIRLR